MQFEKSKIITETSRYTHLLGGKANKINLKNLIRIQQKKNKEMGTQTWRIK